LKRAIVPRASQKQKRWKFIRCGVEDTCSGCTGGTTVAYCQVTGVSRYIGDPLLGNPSSCSCVVRTPAQTPSGCCWVARGSQCAMRAVIWLERETKSQLLFSKTHLWNEHELKSTHRAHDSLFVLVTLQNLTSRHPTPANATEHWGTVQKRR
jgi:hypothetical protein